MDKKLAAEKIRARLEKRVATLLGCEVNDIPLMRLGALVNVLFCLVGDAHELGSYFATCEGLSKVVGRDLFWDEPEQKTQEGEAPIPKVLFLVSRDVIVWNSLIYRSTKDHACKQLMSYLKPDSDEFLRRSEEWFID